MREVRHLIVVLVQRVVGGVAARERGRLLGGVQEAAVGDWRGGEVGGSLHLVLGHLLHEEGFARFAELHVDVERLAVELQINLGTKKSVITNLQMLIMYLGSV